MAKPRRISSSAIARLAEELRFAPKAAARRIIERAESLGGRIDPGELYSEQWLTQQLTGFQTGSAPAADVSQADGAGPRLIPGLAVLADLGPLIDRLSVSAAYADAELGPPDWLGVAELCERWHITRRTLERYRGRGLPGRRARVASGQGKPTWVVRFSRTDVDRFAARNAGALAAAASFSRLGSDEAAEIERAAATGLPPGASNTAVARQIAAELGRSTGSVLRVVRGLPGRLRGKPAPPRPLLADPGALSLRARHFGISPGKVSRRTGLSPAALARRERIALAEALRSIDLGGTGRPKPSTLGDADAVLSQPWVQVGLGEPSAADVRTLVAEANERSWADPVAERQRSAAVALLRARARASLTALDPRRPSAADLDRITTDLCWMSRLIVELVRSQEFAILQTVRAVCGQGLLDLPSAFVRNVWPAVMREAILAVGVFDPGRGGRLASPVGLAVNRLLIGRWDAFITARHQRSGWTAGLSDGPIGKNAGASERATPLAQDDTASLHLADWTVWVHPAQAWCDVPRAAFYGAAELKPAWRELLSARYGWGRYGQAGVRSSAELAAARGVRLEQIRRTERAALTAALKVSKR